MSDLVNRIISYVDEETATLVASRALWATTTNLPTTSNMDNSNTAGTCYGGGDIFWTFFGTLVCGALVAYLAWRLYKKYWNARKGMFSLFDFSGQQISISRRGRGWYSKNPQNFKDVFFKFINSPIRPAVMNGTKTNTVLCPYITCRLTWVVVVSVRRIPIFIQFFDNQKRQQILYNMMAIIVDLSIDSSLSVINVAFGRNKNYLIGTIYIHCNYRSLVKRVLMMGLRGGGRTAIKYKHEILWSISLVLLA